MRVSVFLEHRFDRTPDGAIWTSASFAPSFWQRYLEVFDTVQVVARARDVALPTAHAVRVDSHRVQFLAVPFYLGPRQFVVRYLTIRAAVRSGLVTTDAVLMRVPSPIAGIVRRSLGRNRPYGLEVVGDPLEVMGRGAVNHPLRPLIRWQLGRQLGQQCTGAAAVAYVTQNTLQKRYPPMARAFTTHYSSVELEGESFASQPRTYAAATSHFTIVTVGTLEQMYKGTDVLIDAAHQLVGEGRSLQIVIVGDGKYRPQLEAHVAELSMEASVRFAGQLPSGARIRQELDAADLFILPSRTEGLPRSLIEAMARGLPCIGSDVGGIPELLDSDEMVPPGDSRCLAGKMRELLSDPARLARLSQRNLWRSREYADAVLQSRRREFYEHLKDRTEQFFKERGTPSRSSI